MAGRKLKVTVTPTYITNAAGQKIFLSEVLDEPARRPIDPMDILVKALAVMGWVMFLASINIR